MGEKMGSLNDMVWGDIATLPAALPKDTGTKNPVLRAVMAPSIAYLWYCDREGRVWSPSVELDNRRSFLKHQCKGQLQGKWPGLRAFANLCEKFVFIQ